MMIRTRKLFAKMLAVLLLLTIVSGLPVSAAGLSSNDTTMASYSTEIDLPAFQALLLMQSASHVVSGTYGSAEIGSDEILIIPSGVTFTVPARIDLGTNGAIINNGRITVRDSAGLNINGWPLDDDHLDTIVGGSLTNNGTISVTGYMGNSCLLDNNGTISIGSSGQFINDNNGTINNYSKAIINNTGYFENRGIIHNTSPGVIVNRGSWEGTAPPDYITAQQLPNGTAGAYYSEQLRTVGDAPATFRLLSGNLNGLTLRGDGTLDGTLSQTGTFVLTVLATNAGGTFTSQFWINVYQSSIVPISDAKLMGYFNKTITKKKYNYSMSQVGIEVKSSEREAFLAALLSTRNVAPGSKIFNSVYNLLFSAQYRPNIFGGFDIENWPLQNANSKNGTSVTDAVLYPREPGLKWDYGCRGCWSYAMFCVQYIHGETGSKNQQRFSGTKTGANIKTFLNTHARPGNHIRFTHPTGVHSIVYLAESQNGNGFFYLDYAGGAYMSGKTLVDANHSITLRYITYQNFSNYVVSGLTVWKTNDTSGAANKIIIKASCPVDMIISLYGEELNSAEDQMSASFGTMTAIDDGLGGKIIEAVVDYHEELEIQIIGTGAGTMDFSVSYDTPDNTRSFAGVDITDATIITTTTFDPDGALLLSVSRSGDPDETEEVWYADADGAPGAPDDSLLCDSESPHPEEESITAAFDALTWYEIKGLNDSEDTVVYDLNLPSADDSGNLTITWTSSDLSAIGTDGVVTRGAAERTVELTATMENQDVIYTASFLLTVLASDVPVIMTETDTLAVGTVGVPYSMNFTASGDPTSWAVSSGSLPSGLALNDGGTISGTPATAGTFNFSVTASNGSGASAPVAFQITIGKGTQNAPAGLGKTDETIAGDDGTITNVTADMEYRLSTVGVYTTCVGPTITGLAPGTYLVRCAETVNYNASVDTQVIITAYSAPATYLVTVTNGTGGGNYAEGATVTIKAEAAPTGQQFKEWNISPTVTFVDGTSATETTAEFTMPANDVTVKAIFEPITVTKYTVTVTGSYSATTGQDDYALGVTVTINAGTRSNYSFNGWTVTSGGVTLGNANSATTTFTMPANAVTVTASWTPTGSVGGTAYYYTVTFNLNGGTWTGGGALSQSVASGGSATAPTTTKDGYDFAGWDKSFSNITANTTVTALWTETVIDPKPPTEDGWDNPYSDVADTDWFYDAVRAVHEKDLMKGTSANLFSPSVTLTRAMIVTILWRLEKEPDVEGLYVDFADVVQDSWYETAVGWAAKNKIVLGYPGGFFKPDGAVTREEAVTILYRYAKYKGLDVSASDDLSKFSDMDDISDWALDAMKWAVAVGIVEGRPGNRTAPGDTATRTEIAMIFKRYIDEFLVNDGDNGEPEE